MNIETYKLDKNNRISIAIDFGCNLFSWIADDSEMLACPDGTLGNEDHFYHCGNPLLFPSVGTTFDLSQNPPRTGYYKIFGHDKEYFMPQHGILKYCNWKKISEEKNSKYVKVAFELVIPDEVRKDYYPFNVDYKQTYILRAGLLELESNFINTEDQTVPFVFGYHPYFKLSNTDRDGISVELPCNNQVIIDKNGIHSGKTEKIDSILQLDKNVEYDNVYIETSGKSAFIRDENAARTIEIIYDDTIQTFVLYSKVNANWLCLEPWTNGWMGYRELNIENWQNMNVVNTLKSGESKNIIVKYKVIV